MGSPAAWRETFRETTPLLISGLAVFVALRGGLFNIGAEGQFMLGAMGAAWAGLALRAWPGWLAVLAAALVGACAGGLWALPAGLIKGLKGGHEVISTIMLNNIAIFLAQAMVAGPMKDPNQGSPTSASLPDSHVLPFLVNAMPFRLSWALPIGIALVLAFAWWLRRTVAGYELEAVGENSVAARVAGVDVPKTVILTMSASGAIAGLAGAFQVLAFEHRFYAGFSAGYGFDSLGVALLAGGSTLALIPSALAFGVLTQGSNVLLGVPKGITGVLLGLLIIAFAAFRYRARRVHG